MYFFTLELPIGLLLDNFCLVKLWEEDFATFSSCEGQLCSHLGFLMGCGSFSLIFQGGKLWLILLCRTGIHPITAEDRQIKLADKWSIGKLSSQGTFLEHDMGGGGVRVPYEAGSQGQGLPCTGQSAQHKEARGTINCIC